MKVTKHLGIRTRVVQRHYAACEGRTNDAGWGSGWYLTRTHVMADSLGRSRRDGGSVWLVAQCNFGGECQAHALINELDIVDAMTASGDLPMGAK